MVDVETTRGATFKETFARHVAFWADPAKKGTLFTLETHLHEIFVGADVILPASRGVSEARAILYLGRTPSAFDMETCIWNEGRGGRRSQIAELAETVEAHWPAACALEAWSAFVVPYEAPRAWNAAHGGITVPLELARIGAFYLSVLLRLLRPRAVIACSSVVWGILENAVRGARFRAADTWLGLRGDAFVRCDLYAHEKFTFGMSFFHAALLPVPFYLQKLEEKNPAERRKFVDAIRVLAAAVFPETRPLALGQAPPGKRAKK